MPILPWIFGGEPKLAILDAQFDDLKEIIGKELVEAIGSVIGPLADLVGELEAHKVSVYGVDLSVVDLIVHPGRRSYKRPRCSGC